MSYRSSGASTPACGLHTVVLADVDPVVPMTLHVMYPTDAPETTIQFGPYALSAARDAPLLNTRSRLVVISHGAGGTPFAYRGLAAHLAREGFIVALPEHPRNGRHNNELAGTAEILKRRPQHVRAAIDWVLAAARFNAQLAPDDVALIGHSIGGYTGLALAGGQPSAFGHETDDGTAQFVDVERDERVRRLVLLAPATPWFVTRGSLSQVRLPILLFTGELDPHTPPWQGEIVVRDVGDPTLVEHHAIANAGHFAFQTPFPSQMVSPSFPPSQDPPGFDRAQFQQQLLIAVSEFLRRN